MADEGRRPADGPRLRVLVELRTRGSPALALAMALGESAGGFELDEDFEPVPLGPLGPGMGFAALPETHLVRGTVADEAALDELRGDRDVVGAWIDTPVAPFTY